MVLLLNNPCILSRHARYTRLLLSVKKMRTVSAARASIKFEGRLWMAAAMYSGWVANAF